MRRTSIFKAFPKAFYSKNLYREVGHEWPGSALDYLFVIISCFTLPVILAFIMYSYVIRLDNTLESNVIINQIPDIIIKNSEIITNVKMPYYIKYDGSTQVMAVIDTNNLVEVWEEQMKRYGLILVVGKHRILYKKNDNTDEKILYNVPMELDLQITSSKIRRFVDNYLEKKWLILSILSLLVIVLVFIFSVIAVLFFGICGKIMNIMLRTDISLKDSIRLAAVSTTASFALLSISTMFGVYFSVWTYFIISIAYLCFAIRANKQDIEEDIEV